MSLFPIIQSVYLDSSVKPRPMHANYSRRLEPEEVKIVCAVYVIMHSASQCDPKILRLSVRKSKVNSEIFSTSQL